MVMTLPGTGVARLGATAVRLDVPVGEFKGALDAVGDVVVGLEEGVGPDDRHHHQRRTDEAVVALAADHEGGVVGKDLAILEGIRRAVRGEGRAFQRTAHDESARHRRTVWVPGRMLFAG